ncbi:unnamed protein product [Amoebophrya sp. A25]|nr:unnamed protein product [Amoebophrya sp. A25]|eukprot:GSA25T00024951001.1
MNCDILMSDGAGTLCRAFSTYWLFHLTPARNDKICMHYIYFNNSGANYHERHPHNINDGSRKKAQLKGHEIVGTVPKFRRRSCDDFEEDNAAALLRRMVRP